MRIQINPAGLYLLMKTITLCQLLLGTNQLRIRSLVVEENQIGLDVESTALQALCPECRSQSNQIHSTYPRHPIDLAWAEWGVVLHLKVKRFFCRNPKCPKVTFAERFPGFLARYARKTDRVLEKQRQIGLEVEVCARSAERLLRLWRIGISDTTVNRLLRELPDPPTSKLRAVGVDDWAKCKGQRYGTILVDLERRQIVDLLIDRTADTVMKWLIAQEGIEFVSRDRSKAYAEAIAAGAPQAIQVADRWHLLKNLSEAVFKLFQKNYALIKQQLDPESDANNEEGAEEQPVAELGKDETILLTPAEERRRDRYLSKLNSDVIELGSGNLSTLIGLLKSSLYSFRAAINCVRKNPKSAIGVIFSISDRSMFSDSQFLYLSGVHILTSYTANGELGHCPVRNNSLA
jgi:transposase